MGLSDFCENVKMLKIGKTANSHMGEALISESIVEIRISNDFGVGIGAEKRKTVRFESNPTSKCVLFIKEINGQRCYNSNEGIYITRFEPSFTENVNIYCMVKNVVLQKEWLIAQTVAGDDNFKVKWKAVYHDVSRKQVAEGKHANR